MAARRILVAFLLASALAPVYGWGDGAELAACASHLAADPESEESAECFHKAGQGPGAQEPAIQRLEELRTRFPGRPWLLFYLGHLRWTDPARNEGLFREAAELFAARGDALGELRARDSRALSLMQLSRPEEADREVARAVQVAGTSTDPGLHLRAQLLEARHLFMQKRDMERVYYLARQAEATAFPGAEYGRQRDCLLLLGNASLVLGKIHEARDAFRRLARLANGNADRFAEATASYSLTRSLMDEIDELPRESVRREALASARQALAAAEAAGHRSVEAKTHLILGMLATDPESRGHLENCSETAPSPLGRSYCLGMLARRLADTEPARSSALVEQAFTLARESGDLDGLVAAWRERMRLAWKTLPPKQAALDSGSALQTLEALRESRSDPASPERLASGTEDYYWLSGRLLEAGLPERAFDVTERMRSRALTSALEAARARPAESEAAVRLRERRAAILGEIAGIQRGLFDPGVPPWEKAESRHALERLEARGGRPPAPTGPGEPGRLLSPPFRARFTSGVAERP